MKKNLIVRFLTMGTMLAVALAVVACSNPAGPGAGAPPRPQISGYVTITGYHWVGGTLTAQVTGVSGAHFEWARINNNNNNNNNYYYNYNNGNGDNNNNIVNIIPLYTVGPEHVVTNYDYYEHPYYNKIRVRVTSNNYTGALYAYSVPIHGQRPRINVYFYHNSSRFYTVTAYLWYLINEPQAPTQNPPYEYFWAWYRGASSGPGTWDPADRWYFDYDIVMETTWLYPRFTAPPETFQVDFNPGGGALANNHISPQMVRENTSFTAPPAPTWQYHTFLGWYTDNDIWQNRWIFAPAYNAMLVTEPMTLYARWQAYITINFYYANGNLHQSRRVPAGVLLTNPPVLSDTNTQYFAGWFATGAANAWDFTTTAFTQNTRLDARFNSLHRVQFYNNEGEVETTLYLRSGVAINENQAPSLSPPVGNYEFGGWRIGNAQGERWYFAPATNATLVTGNVSLHPRWYGLHRLTFETGLMGQEEYYRILREGDLLGVAPEYPQLNGSSERFMGWFRDRTFQRPWDIANDRMPGHDITVYARWGGFVTGELGPSGGVIFYSRAYNNPFTLFRHVGDTGVYAWYLEAAPSSLPMSPLLHQAWRLYPENNHGIHTDLSPAADRGIGHGMKNTDFWYNLTANNAQVFSPAARNVRAFDGGGWFIPSVHEIEHLIGVSPPDHPIRMGYWLTSTWAGSLLNSFQVAPGGVLNNLWSGNANTYVWPARAW